ncbi:hypothetical protein CPAST_c31380 [Clostridium pasteurianum DSM 525 = ATCC 6013]|uniref:DUF202 domain-containing protein n=1 Tax=Clostridium pasteurianum DSM 525 = ATCC 6013 TaxID=1262449 RepID=A0A0H3J6V8_CLOPA|nr:DUF202 domain-containing protein [Clostridium pasteurianum]AJA49204.1 hypothetical protein CPAST_c31380 [Clostridium pasteurianum DSM 525 = ATCC 6013]AJA53192.1 hypothetical protein CLPA_c31380 [Clostridium pasteurianum DSM 525 = ATCC 6013]AOZ76386.1 hypothetical protein AQ983_15230 [Clostridium pasteurianum DSM 525 = ATCC 6013]AOZ80183.1 hypothetical protein AQ984_15225 [Clostridium pasteurianum]ELP59137.1 hypothetical protein F502_11646 [Clostridium pasteurianum DSM 525 = ATCC 6013]
MSNMDDNSEETVYNFNKKDMILRDFLAADRTALANERTLLAYIRTGISLIIIAISLIKLFDDTFTYVLGIVCGIFSIIPIVLGIYKYRKMNKKLSNILYK